MTPRCGLPARLWIAALLLAATFASLVRGQSHHFEITPFVGYTFSDGIQVQPQNAGGGLIYNELIPKSHLSWGIQGECVFDESGFGLGFLYSDQPTTLELGPARNTTPPLDATDMHIRNYYGYFALNFNSGERVRPFFLVGFGATTYSFSPIMGNPIEGDSRFGVSLAGGVKYYLNEHIGFRGMGRWTPTYINSDVQGIWCSPFWWGACWAVTNANFSNQFEASGGVIFAF